MDGPAGVPDTSRDGICACGSPQAGEEASGGGLWLAAGVAARAGRGRLRVIGASFGARGGTGVPVLRAFRVRASGAARAYRGGAVHAPDCPRETAGRGPLRKCHEMSCDVMEGVGGLWLAAGFAAGAGEGRLRSCVPPFQAKGRDGVSLFCARFACARLRGRGRAYRGGAARARDCPRETAHAPRPSVPAGVFLAAPASRFLQKSRKAAPEAASLYFHSNTLRLRSSPCGNKK